MYSAQGQKSRKNLKFHFLKGQAAPQETTAGELSSVVTWQYLFHRLKLEPPCTA